jgi:hypothetical protein
VATGTGPGGQQLTPMQRLRQLEPSWLRSGQTTSLFASVMEKEDVRDDLGGILDDCLNSSNPTMRRRGVLAGRRG